MFYSSILRVILLELFDDLVVVLLYALNVVTYTVHRLFYVVVCLEDAVLVAETG